MSETITCAETGHSLMRHHDVTSHGKVHGKVQQYMGLTCIVRMSSALVPMLTMRSASSASCCWSGPLLKRRDVGLGREVSIDPIFRSAQEREDNPHAVAPWHG
jgi:hypothetical protein